MYFQNIAELDSIVSQCLDPMMSRCLSRLWSTLRLVTLEPIVFLVVFSGGLSSVIAQNLIIQKVCRQGSFLSFFTSLKI